MSYQIQYESEKNRQYPIKTNRLSVKRIVITATIAVLVICLLSSPSFKRFIIPGDPKITGAAFSRMIDDLQNGDTVGEAITTFCREIVHNGS